MDLGLKGFTKRRLLVSHRAQCTTRPSFWPAHALFFTCRPGCRGLSLWHSCMALCSASPPLVVLGRWSGAHR
jgi:hypothetical protein